MSTTGCGRGTSTGFSVAETAGGGGGGVGMLMSGGGGGGGGGGATGDCRGRQIRRYVCLSLLQSTSCAMCSHKIN